LRIGKLRHRLSLQGLITGSPQLTPSGAPNTEWGEIAEVYGSIEPLNGRELFAAQAINSEITARIKIRYREGVTTDMRISHEGKLYNIHSIIDPELRHMELQLMASEGINLG
jgi:SPP1 family predicted phage head-tail adaptor